MREGDQLIPSDWGTAMGRIVDRSTSVLAEYGPLSHGFYTSGHLFLEEYYALAVLGKAGIGTPHMDGNTRLCTATAATLPEGDVGCDGQPGAYDDIEETDALFLFGHNAAETQTVLWSRILDRLAGQRSPARCVSTRAAPRLPELQTSTSPCAGYQSGVDERARPGVDRKRVGRHRLRGAAHLWL